MRLVVRFGWFSNARLREQRRVFGSPCNLEPTSSTRGCNPRLLTSRYLPLVSGHAARDAAAQLKSQASAFDAPQPINYRHLARHVVFERDRAAADPENVTNKYIKSNLCDTHQRRAANRPTIGSGWVRQIRVLSAQVGWRSTACALVAALGALLALLPKEWREPLCNRRVRLPLRHGQKQLHVRTR